MHIQSRSLALATVAAAVIALVAAPVAAAARPVAAEDLFKLSLVSSSQISHDGKQIVFVVTKLDGPKNTYLNNLWLADVGGGRVWQLTRGDSDGVHARTAEPIYGRPRHLDRQSCQQQRHARYVTVIFAGLVGAAVDDVVDR